jgi:transcriptional regulator with XRE-family HTH domain
MIHAAAPLISKGDRPMAELNTERLAAMVRAKRGKRGLREVAKEIGNVSASTLSRVEQGKVPDLETFFELCKWLNVGPEEFTGGNLNADQDAASTPEKIEIHLRADRTLEPETVDALITMVKLAYEAARRK